MKHDEPYALSIAGFDPSGGAGVLADIKTFESLGVSGFGVLSANTIQNDRSVKRVDWLPVATVLEQTAALLERFPVDFFKIGIVRSGDDLRQITAFIRQQRPQAFIVWDPVLRSSSGFDFFDNGSPVEELLSALQLVTPNLPEFGILFGQEERALALSASTLVYRKGGHCEEQPGTDYLYQGGEKRAFAPLEAPVSPKHGSGCVLSSALCAHLAKGYPLDEACRRSKRYMERFLSSRPGLLGRHVEGVS
ncbi:hydroxymethylpyrimidine/phosphomethylpyrimidine kinase [Paraflavisolibacter sp. H34]|uniref:hydroxymethylpyrimidine/phosphomethylpyrimidine kinase n=1 Tax=Huijunlia imazamoxiresistens TaxID=3127457 RepID=UPI00301AF4CF